MSPPSLRLASSTLRVVSSYSHLGSARAASSARKATSTNRRQTVPKTSSAPKAASQPQGQPTPTSSTSDKAEEKTQAEDKSRIPFLNQPLGVRERPTGTAKTWRDTVFDDDLRVEQRKKLVKEASKSYFHDLNATRSHGGKTWIAPPVLIREDKARYFPDILGTSLNSQKVHTTDLLQGKVSLVSILSSKISEIQTGMFTEPTHAEYSDNRHYQHIKVNLQENLMRSLLVSIFAGSIRKTIPKEQWGQYLISGQNMDYVREDIGLTNKFLGYVYLVDYDCRIRWAGCADPQPGEIQALRICTGQLLKRLGK